MELWHAGEQIPLGNKWNHVYFKSFPLVCIQQSLFEFNLNVGTEMIKGFRRGQANKRGKFET